MNALDQKNRLRFSKEFQKFSEPIITRRNRNSNLPAYFPLHVLCEKCPNTEFFLVRIFPHSHWTRSYLSVFSPNVGKYGPEKSPYLDTFHAVMASTNIYLIRKKTIQKPKYTRSVESLLTLRFIRLDPSRLDLRVSLRKHAMPCVPICCLPQVTTFLQVKFILIY